jgi:hypothetical protein
MTILDDQRTPAYVPRLHRRHEIVTTGGMDGVLRIGQVLATCGYQVRDFAADVRDGVRYSSVICTVALTGTEAAVFADRLLAVPAVVAVDPR